LPRQYEPNRPTRRCLTSALRLSAACALIAIGCDVPAGSDGRRGEGPGHRQQDLGLSPREELRVGREAYEKVLAEYRGRILPDTADETQQVRKIVDGLGRAAKIEPLQREINLRVEGYEFQWEVHVVRERQVNAFCLPAGKMVVFTGIMAVAQNEAQLAAVLSHEMAHALAHHGSERVARERSGAGILGSLKYDRFQEAEADKIGVFLMPFAGYDPDEAVNFWRRMARVTGGGGEVPEILSDHPSHATRIKNLALWVPRARAAKQAYDEGRIAPAGRGRR
jgi:predicted Zn-dependent protease